MDEFLAKLKRLVDTAPAESSLLLEDDNFCTGEQQPLPAVIFVTGLLHLADEYCLGPGKRITVPDDPLFPGEELDAMGYGIVEYHNVSEANEGLDNLDGKEIADGQKLSTAWLYRQPGTISVQEEADFYVRARWGYGHCVHEVEARPDGRVRFASRFNCKAPESRQFYQFFVTRAVVLELKRIVLKAEAEFLEEEDPATWPQAGLLVGRDEVEYVVGDRQKLYSTSCVPGVPIRVREGSRRKFHCLKWNIFNFLLVPCGIYYPGMHHMTSCQCEIEGWLGL